MRRVLQSVFYLLRYEKEDTCERDTNRLDWKKSKCLINKDFLQRLEAYNPFGPKDEDYLLY